MRRLATLACLAFAVPGMGAHTTLTVSPTLTAAAHAVEGAVFFPAAALLDKDLIELRRSSDSASVPVQTEVIAEWPDSRTNGIKSLRVVFVAERGETYTLAYGRGEHPAAPARPVHVRDSGGSVTIDTGPLVLVISRTQFDVLHLS